MRIYTKTEKKDIKSLMRKTKDTVMYRKYQSILLHMKSFSNTKISEIGVASHAATTFSVALSIPMPIEK